MRHEKSFDKYSADAVRESGRKGGIASGIARREKRQAIEREKIHNAAMREMRMENIRMIYRAAEMLKYAKRGL